MASLFIVLSILIPWFFAICVYLFKKDIITSALSYLLLPILAFFAFKLFYGNLPVFIHTSKLLDILMDIYDFGLLIYFLYIGVKYKNGYVTSLAILQITLLIIVLMILPDSKTANIFVDKLTVFIYIIVALVGTPIVIYATKYMDYDEKNKHKFVAILLWFLGVMNFAVSVNNIEWFFALFETTTLASYALISFRKDEEAVNNGLLALWMNQIGGVAILIALMLMVKDNGYYYFTDIIDHPKNVAIAALGFLSLSALVKGAQMPFQNWLLGAMVAPTPVSAILHSATMVKIAPYLILRISPVIHNTLLAKLLIITTGYVFVTAAIIALTQENFKRILAYSTISLLGLMMLTAAVGTPIAITASLVLILFHAFAKGFLFIEAGILEKVFHVKYINQMRRLIERAPLTMMFIFFGFLNMTFVPFGVFIGKWMMIEEASNFLTHGSYIILIVLVGAGSAFLSILYMKVLGVSVRKAHGIERVKFIPLSKTFNLVSFWYYLFLLAMTVFMAPLIADFIVSVAKNLITVGNLDISSSHLSLIINHSTLFFWQIIGALSILILIHALPYIVKFKADFVTPYNCGENHPKYLGTWDFKCIQKFEPYLMAFSIALFIITVVLGGGLL